MTAQRPGMLALGALAGRRGVPPFGTPWDVVGEHFADPRLRQVFGRMAGYVGTSPLQAPATRLLSRMRSATWPEAKKPSSSAARPAVRLTDVSWLQPLRCLHPLPP